MAFDTLATANDLSSSISFSGLLTLSNSFDFHRFQLQGRSSVQVLLTNLTGDAYLEIVQDRDRNGTIDTAEILHRSVNSGGISERLAVSLETGTYFVRVATASEDANYTLQHSIQTTTRSDLVWRNLQTGQNSIWTMNGATRQSDVWLPTIGDVNWQIVAASDFNSDGQSDLVWRNLRTGQNVIWMMNGATRQSEVWLPSIVDGNWQIVGANDFNNDARPDLLWRNSASGQNVIWYMNGVVKLSDGWLPTIADSNWQIVGTGDFNQDARADIVWRNLRSGQNVVWYLNGLTRTDGWLPTLMDSNWQIVGTSDFNQDTRPDLVWRNTSTGQNSVWYMNGVLRMSDAWLPTVDRNWQIAEVSQRFEESPLPDVPENFNLGLINGTGIFRDRVSVSDPVDTYQFSVGEISDVTIWLTNLTSDVNFQILDRTGTIIQTVTGTMAQNRSAALRLNTGIYSLRVFQPSGDASYRLQISGIPRPHQRYDFIYYYNGQNANSDYYTGYVVAPFGTYTVDQFFDFTSANNETGSNGRYLITGSQNWSNAADLGKVFVTNYFDVDSSNTSFTPNQFSQGTHAGSNYLGSETDTIGLAGNNFDSFGNDRTEFDGIFAYNFRYYFNGTTTGTQDSYDGVVIARVGTYAVGSFVDPRTQNNETGFNGRYLITGYQVYNDPNARSQLGWVFLNSYFNSENSTNYTPVGQGRNFLGSEVGWLRSSQLAEEQFGQDSLEADILAISAVSVGGSLRQGLATTITWNDNLSENVRIELLRGGLFVANIETSTLSDGSQVWTPGTNFAIASDYQIRISSVLDSTIFALSNTFAIRSPGTVRITNPNGGNVLRPNSSYTINWTDDFDENVRLELWKGGAFHSTIATSTASDGSETWSVPNLSNGSDYEIRIFSVLNSAVSDRSDAFFSVQADLRRYWFTYNYNANNPALADSYIGSVIAVDGAYTVNSTFDPANRLTEAGTNGNYVITRVEDYDDRFTSDLGRVFVTEYIDRDNGAERRFAPRLHRLGQAAGTNYLGSELDFLDDAQTEITRFGQDLIEADPRPEFNIQFDYRFDTIGWFTPARRALLEAAADIWEKIILDEFRDIPIGTQTPYVMNPQTGELLDFVTTNFVIDDLLIFVGARELGGTVLGQAWNTGFYAGESRYSGADYEPWMGSMAFDISTNWFFDATLNTSDDIPWNQFDFLSTALHEIGHILGFIRGTVAFNNHVSGDRFVGANAKVYNGGNPVPLQPGGTHFDAGYTFPTSGAPLMDPYSSAGARSLPTLLDAAVLDDIGYTVNYNATFRNSSGNLLGTEPRIIAKCSCSGCLSASGLSEIGSSNLEQMIGV